MSKTELIKYYPSTTTTIPYYPEVVSIGDIKQNPNLYKDKLVRIRGYGVMVATLPLCPDYVGFDTRYMFMDSQKNTIYTQVKNSSSNINYRDHLQTFEGYIRIFDSQIGCPGEIKIETFPYFEIISVE
jgi:hypothetical protein